MELQIGPYQGKGDEHRRCEMRQDSFIFPRVMDVGDTGLSEHLATGIGLEDWNLDTRRSVQTGQFVFWREQACRVRTVLSMLPQASY